MRALRELFRKWFGEATPLELATKELADAERRLLVALTARDYADTDVDYNRRRIMRLRQYIGEAAYEDPKDV